MPRLLLVRHGQTNWNKEHRFQGSTDIPLNEIGRQQAKALGRALADECVDAIWASDLQRATDTARAVAAHHGLEIKLDPRLREFNGGDWEGMVSAEIHARYPDEMSQWLYQAATTSPPNGEPIAETVGRLQAVLEDVRALPDDHTLVIAAHGGVNDMLISIATSHPLDIRFQFRAGEASITEMDIDARRTSLVRLNDQHHLDGLAH